MATNSILTTFCAGTPQDAALIYERNGFVIADVFSSAETALLESFALKWLTNLIKNFTGISLTEPLSQYHLWHSRTGVDHGRMLQAANRHMTPPREVGEILCSATVRAFLTALAPGVSLTPWDEGLGWLAFRLIRPGYGDGYPLSCKAWGPAPRVISLWIPVIGFSPLETLGLVPGSHRKVFERHLPTKTKFCAQEWRLSNPPEDLELVRPPLKPGQVIIYGPRTLHTEDVVDSPISRFNLEMRWDTADAER